MTLLTSMHSNKLGVVTATTKEGGNITLEDCAHVDVVFGLNEGNNVKNAIEELKNKARYNDSKFYWLPERDSKGDIAAKFSEDKKTFAIPYAYFFK